MQTIFAIVGPTNVGKDTVMHALLAADLGLMKAVTSATRAPRPGEVDGVDYNFFSREEFERKIKSGEFFEWSIVHADYKGLLKRSIFEDVPKNKNIIMQTDVHGFPKIKSSLDPARFRLVGIFLIPPSFNELIRRMQARGTEVSPYDIKKRLDDVELEMKEKDVYDYQVMNDDLDKCIAELSKIVIRESAPAKKPRA
jgi:guanylate kinase